MSDTRLEELLSAAEDQALSTAERDELEDLLESTPDAAQIRERYRWLGEYLERARPLVPPPELANRIISGARLPAADRSLGPVWGLSRLFAPAVLGYGIAAAAGMLATVAFYESGSTLLDIPDVSRLAGSLAPDTHTELESIQFETGGVAASARLSQRHDMLVLDIRFDAERPLRVAAEVGGPGVEFEGLLQAPGDPQVVTLAAGHLVIDGKGRQAIAAILRTDATADGGAEVRLEFASEGRLLHHGTLVTGAQR